MKSNILTSFSRLAAVCACGAFLAASSYAAPINYGDVDDIANGGEIEYLQIIESTSTDDEPLYGPPSVTINQLDFDPAGFGASASNGDIDITDGQLNFSFDTVDGKGITSLQVDEGGDYSFLNGGPATTINYTLIGRVTITEVDGVSLPPAGIPIDFSRTMSLASPGPGLTPDFWSLGALIEFGPALATAGFDPTAVVTAGDFFVNNQLIASSETGSLAFIAKKDFTVTPSDPIDIFDIPEPTAALLAVLALGGIVSRRR